jgi:multidrug efflux pump subunit AcrA (membrane-fusion protein)
MGLAMRTILLLLLASFVACGDGGGKGDWGGQGEKGEETEFKIPVRSAKPSRGSVEDWVETQANLASDRRALILAEVDGRIVEQHRDLGDQVGEARDGEDRFLLARIDDRDLRLAYKEAQIKIKEQQGRLQELEVDQSRSARALDRSRLEAEEAAAALRRTTSGIKDGAITYEEHEKALFAEKVARARVLGLEVELEKSRVAQTLGGVMVEDSRVKLERAQVALDKASLRAPFDGVVSFCDVNVGQRVRGGDHLYTIEDPSKLVVFADIPVREAYRIRKGNPARVFSSAVPNGTTGRVVLVAPTVDSAAGTVRVKMAVDPKPGFNPGLFVNVLIVVEQRENALIIPKRAVLHDDETGAYLYVLAGDGSTGNRARRVDIKTGYETESSIEIIAGVTETDDVVVEGQDTLSDDALVELLEAE